MALSTTNSFQFDHQDEWWLDYGNRLKKACEVLGAPSEDEPKALGLDVFPIIPVDLPVEQFHRVKPDGNGKYEPVLDGNGNLVPFSSKQPAYWVEYSNGTIRRLPVHWDAEKALKAGKEVFNPQKILDSVCTALRIGHAIGIAAKTTKEMVVIDFDLKPFATPEEKEKAKDATDAQAKKDALAPAQARMEAAVDAWLYAHPELSKTRAERTPSGDYHFWIKVQDQMSSWADGVGKDGKEIHHVNFALSEDGNHVGEILCGRICVTAPTQNGRGPYELLNAAHELEVVEVKDLASVGIYPVAKSKRTRTQSLPDGTVRTIMREPQELPPRPVCSEDFEAPLLVSLLGGKAQDVYGGELSYKGSDRSANLSGFINEINGWVAFLHDQGLPYEDGGLSVEEHIHRAAEAIGLEDAPRVDRIVKSCDKRLSSLSVPPEQALLRYRAKQGGELPDGFKGLVETERNPFDLCSASLRDVLTEIARQGLSGSDVAFKLKAIAEEFDEQHYVVEKLYRQLKAEDSEEDEAGSALAEFLRTQSLGNDLEGILPDKLTSLLAIITRTAKYEPPVLVMTLVSACSAAMPLTSSVQLNEIEDFEQCLNVWFTLLMESGELKSPLIRRIISDPYRKAVKSYLRFLRGAIEQALIEHCFPSTGEVNEMMRDNEVDLRTLPPEARVFINRNIRKMKYIANQEGSTPYHVARAVQTELGANPSLLINGGGSKQGFDAEFEIHAKWAGKGILYLQDEMKALFIKLAKPSNTELDFAEWLLSRYDGTGQREAKADTTRVRNYDSCRVSVMGGIQPDVYRNQLDDGDTSGMTARFNAYEQPTVDQEFPDVFSLEERNAARRLSTTLQELYEFLLHIPELELRLSDEAFKKFQAFRRKAFKTKRAESTDAGKSLSNKAHGKVGRLAAILHVLHYAVGANYQVGAIYAMSPVISDDTMDRAIRLHDLLYQRTLGVRLTSGDNSPVAQLSLKIHRMAKGKDEGLGLSQIRASFKSTTRPEMSEVISICKELEAQGLGRLEDYVYRGRPGHRYVHLKDV